MTAFTRSSFLPLNFTNTFSSPAKFGWLPVVSRPFSTGLFCIATFGLLCSPTAFAQRAENSLKPVDAAKQNETKQNESKPGESPTRQQKSVAAIAAEALDSIVVIRQINRDGESHSLGSGFVISDDGLIATNLHVIGEARPLRVETKSGKTYRVIEVHASERQMDLAIVRVANPVGLKPLPIFDSTIAASAIADPTTANSKLRPGDSVVVIGHPRGLQHTVVEGLLSARKEIEGQPMLQLSIPIEQGNSGGPVLDRQGRVHGVLTLKSLQAENTGFAVESVALKQLLAKPNPITMDRWLTIGELDLKTWEPVFEARWMQRVDRILVDGSGAGFGGRSLCLRRKPMADQTDNTPIALSVDVRMDDESGAAGLVLHSDGKDRHYGFYPSNGRIRLTRFDGPDVYSWNVLQEVQTDAYRPGEWNSLRVVLNGNQTQCFVNNQLVVTSLDRRYTSGRPGLAKFRQTQAEFRNFRITRLTTPGEVTQQTLDRWRPVQPAAESLTLPDIEQLAADSGVTSELLEEHARRLEQQATAVRQLSDRLNTQRVQQQLVTELALPEDKINLIRATLLIAQLDNQKLDIQLFEREVERMAEQISKRIKDNPNESQRIEILNQFLFKENGFHGNRVQYDTRSNSYMNDVIYNRQGLPITLSVLYMELAQRIGLKVVGVGLPGHFVVRWETATTVEGDESPTLESQKPETINNDPANKSPDQNGTQLSSGGQLIDPFERGAKISMQDANRLIRAAGFRPTASFFAAQSKPQIIERMLRNLVGLAEQNRETERLLRYMETLVRLFPEETEFRAKRVDLNSRTGDIDSAIADIDWFLKHKPAGVEIEKLKEFREFLQNRR